MRSVIVDAGPLVALINAKDANHTWAAAALASVRAPMVTCEAALSEAFFLLRACHGGPVQLVGMLQSGGLVPDFCLASELPAVCRLLAKYRDLPMSLADACLVRMAEMHPRHLVMTLDTDFRVYRLRRNARVPLLIPE